MAFDFPNSPTLGQTYQVTGGPTYVWNGTAWQVLTPGSRFNRQVYTATAGQTTFNATYLIGGVDVFHNGVKLAPADFTASNGSTVVLVSAANAGDTIEIVSYSQVNYTNAVQKTGDTMTGNLNFSGNGLRITGDLGTATLQDRLSIQSNVTNGNSVLQILPNGTASISAFQGTNAPDPNNAALFNIAIIGTTDVRVESTARGTGTYVPMTFHTGGSERMRLDTSGNLGISTTGPVAKLDLGRATAINQIQAVLARQAAPGDGDFRLVASTGAGTAVDNEFFRVGITYNANFLAGMNFYRGQGSTDGYFAFSTTATERMRIDANGNIGIGTIPNTSYLVRTTFDGGKGANFNTFAMGKSGGDYAWAGYNFIPTASSGVYNYNASDYAAAIRYGQAGAIQVFTASLGTSGTTISWASGPYVALSGTSWTSASDERLKNITGLITDALPKVNQLRAAEFTWKSDSTNKPQVGLIAQDVLKVLPEAVDTTTDPEAFGVSYTEVIPLLVAAVQELSAKLDAAEARIAQLEGTN